MLVATVAFGGMDLHLYPRRVNFARHVTGSRSVARLVDDTA